MISVAPKITEAGKSLQIRALCGEKITFTRFKIGNGEISSGADTSNFTDLVNPLISFPIMGIDKKTAGYVKLTGSFNSTDITTDFRWRELGIFCEGEKTALLNGDGTTKTFKLTDVPSAVNSVKVSGTAVTVSSYNSSTGVVTLAVAPANGTQNVAINYPDGDEKLYAYTNDGNNAGMLKANSTDVVSEQTVALIIAVGETANVTAIISESVLYAKKTDFESHTAAKNPHGTTKADIGLGNVPNVSTNDQTVAYSVSNANSNLVSGEKISTAFGKIAKAVKSLIAHLADKNNPHDVDAETIGAAAKEHTHSTANISSGVMSILRGGTGKGSWVKNGVVFADKTDSLSQLTPPTSESVLTQKDGAPQWKNIEDLGAVVIGTYMGNGSSGKNLPRTEQKIVLGFKPKAVIVSNCLPIEESSDVTTLEALGATALSTASTNRLLYGGIVTQGMYLGWKNLKALEITENGFKVSSGYLDSPNYGYSYINETGYLYSYIAFK